VIGGSRRIFTVSIIVPNMILYSNPGMGRRFERIGLA